jgi:hypothetical protein
MLTIFSFIFELGTKTWGWNFALAFRIRVKISAIGFSIVILPPTSLPFLLQGFHLYEQAFESKADKSQNRGCTHESAHTNYSGYKL